MVNEQLKPEEFKQAVEVLDKIYPKWHQNINCDTLDMASDRDCILGQLYPGMPFWESLALTREHGYYGDSAFGCGKVEWLKLIQERVKNE